MPGPAKTPQSLRLFGRLAARRGARIVSENAGSSGPARVAVYGASLANLFRREATDG
jgi:hypothetical protein